MSMDNSIVITGIGIVSAIGNDKSTVLQSLLDGRSGIERSARWLNLPVGEVNLSDNDMKTMLGIDSAKEVSRTALLGMVAVSQALNDAKLCSTTTTLPFSTPDWEGSGVGSLFLVSGTTVGGMDVTERHFNTFDTSDEHLDCIPKHDCGSSTNEIVEHFGVFSDSTTLSTACSSGLNAIITGARLLKDGEADIVVAGGTESLTMFHLCGFNSLMILDHERCRPFEEDRAGLNLGEGAGYVVMETECSARKRNVPILAYVTGYGNACDAFHQTASSPDGEGAFLAMKEAIDMAGIRPADIDYVNAHGTGTQNNDLSESAAIKRIFGDNMPYVSSTKSLTGHTTSASGGIEAVICLLAMQHHSWQNVLCNSFGFGGNDSSLVLGLSPSVHPNGVLAAAFLQKKRGEKCEVREAARVEITDEEQLAEIRNYVKPLEARRMGKLMKGSLLSSLKALEQAGIERPDAIISATRMGCLENSELLLRQLTAGESLSPTLFMQSTHNTIGANIAIRTGCHGYNVTYVHGEKSLEWALRDAHLLLSEGKVHNVLVGLHEETTPFYKSLLSRIEEREERIEERVIHSISIVLTCGE